MAQPYVGEIRMFAGNFPPVGWLFCEGQLLPISENETLFQLIGTTYGGDGESTFGLPDLRGRIPIHQGSETPLAQQGGVEAVTLTTQQIPTHTHALLGSSDTANSPNPSQNVLARSPQVKAFINGNPGVAMSPQFLGPVGGSQPHTNFQPYLCVDFIISLFGIFPSPT
ncbi:MAG TPA: tail fiber protein [Allosphingosinicella sp.]|jgi:microcystin-dependent protein